ncbi:MULTISPECIES: hypothetical protein [unclassified Chelatococcus]|uniref:hypothetical protein n=1 Tax=unclassified Chelatococcus TaxID=2638111 RepID=UPI001BCB831F|nr:MULTISPECIES: hypothetical protein [unclassified Chelatococcus]MBS7697826.1 hypothetical protein [Chelatococcus sp. YT9]MBX3559819.1 hypothetical protein [Chelatococcus sp.]
MTSPNVIAAARLLREEGYAVVKLEWSPDMATAGEEALAASEHLPEEDAAAHVYAAVLSHANAATAKAMGEVEADQMTAHDDVWASVPEAAHVNY